jgi:serine/threonine protein kinase
VPLEARRGLAAAHAIGIVHRDFKPDNLLVSADGHARVSDFGLAGSNETAAAASIDGDLHRSSTGQLIGTPLYMAPEQPRGARADARTDQFSFCVTLFEALFGVRPFSPGDPPSLAGLLRSVDAGRIAPMRLRRMPGWLLGVVRRGLSPKPEERFPSMEALLDALAPASARSFSPPPAPPSLYRSRSPRSLSSARARPPRSARRAIRAPSSPTRIGARCPMRSRGGSIATPPTGRTRGPRPAAPRAYAASSRR